MSIVSIKGLPKGAVLAAFFNGTQPIGMGFLQAGRGPTVMDAAKGEEVIASGQQDNMIPSSMTVIGPTADARARNLYFDYLYGRPLKLDISGDEVDTRLYDRDSHTPGAVVVSKLRSELGIPEPPKVETTEQ